MGGGGVRLAQNPTLSPPLRDRIARASSGVAISSPRPSSIWRTRTTCAAFDGEVERIDRILGNDPGTVRAMGIEGFSEDELRGLELPVADADGVADAIAEDGIGGGSTVGL